MKKKSLKAHFFAAALMIQTGDLASWSQLQYSKIPTNKLSVQNNQLVVQVQSSASPLIYVLPAVQQVSGFSVDLEIKGNLKAVHAPKFEEDSYFRLGLVATGDKKLNAFQKALAPDWIKKLFDLSPKGYGLDKIYFFSLGHDPQFLNLSRKHPQSELIYEKIVKVKQKDQITFEYQLDKPIQTAALWISIDGDDTHSSFEIKIKNFKIFGPQ